MPHHCHSEHCDHDHSDDTTPAIQNLLYSQLDFAQVRTLNESTPHSGRAVLQKDYSHRLDATPELASDADEQLLMHVPFTGQVRLHSLHVRTSDSPSAPRTLKIFANSEDLDFTSAPDAKVTQTVELSRTNDVQDIPVKRALFNATRSLCLFFKDNWSGGEEDVTRVGWVAFKGDFMRLIREPVDVLYEAAARPTDHKVKGQAADVGGAGLGSGRHGF